MQEPEIIGVDAVIMAWKEELTPPSSCALGRNEQILDRVLPVVKPKITISKVKFDFGIRRSKKFGVRNYIQNLYVKSGISNLKSAVAAAHCPPTV